MLENSKNIFNNFTKIVVNSCLTEILQSQFLLFSPELEFTTLCWAISTICTVFRIVCPVTVSVKVILKLNREKNGEKISRDTACTMNCRHYPKSVQFSYESYDLKCLPRYQPHQHTSRFSLHTNAWPAAQQRGGWSHPAWHVPTGLFPPLPCAAALPARRADRSSTRPAGSISRGQASPPALTVSCPHAAGSTSAGCPRLHRVSAVRFGQTDNLILYLGFSYHYSGFYSNIFFLN